MIPKGGNRLSEKIMLKTKSWTMIRFDPIGSWSRARDMRLRGIAGLAVWLLAAGLLSATGVSFAQGVTGVPAAAGDYPAKADQYARARQAFEEEAGAYWKSISEKRAARITKRRNNEPIGLDDYVLTQPPVYQGPPRPVDPPRPWKTVSSTRRAAATAARRSCARKISHCAVR